MRGNTLSVDLEAVQKTFSAEGIQALINGKLRTSRYVDEFLRLRCSADMLAFGLFPNMKEITESFGAYSAARRVVSRKGWSFNDPDTTVICVGDGSTPRTAATFAFRSKWRCLSVDPVLQDPVRFGGIDRLGVHQCHLSALDAAVSNLSRLLIVCVHSHVAEGELDQFVDRTYKGDSSVISIPCCTPHNTVLGRPPEQEYTDMGIWSPQNTVKIWYDAVKPSESQYENPAWHSR